LPVSPAMRPALRHPPLSLAPRSVLCARASHRADRRRSTAEHLAPRPGPPTWRRKRRGCPAASMRARKSTWGWRSVCRVLDRLFGPAARQITGPNKETVEGPPHKSGAGQVGFSRIPKKSARGFVFEVAKVGETCAREFAGKREVTVPAGNGDTFHRRSHSPSASLFSWLAFA